MVCKMARINYCIGCKKVIKKNESSAIINLKSKSGKGKFHFNCLAMGIAERVIKPAVKIVNKEHLKNYRKIRNMLSQDTTSDKDLERLKI